MTQLADEHVIESFAYVACGISQGSKMDSSSYIQMAWLVRFMIKADDTAILISDILIVHQNLKLLLKLPLCVL